MLDVLVTGGTVYDGSGTAGRRADVGVGGDRVAVVGDMPGERKAGDVIDAAGMAVAPALQPAGPSPRLRLFSLVSSATCDATALAEALAPAVGITSLQNRR